MKRKYVLILSGIIALVFFAMAFLKASVNGLNAGGNGFKRNAGISSLTKIAEQRFQQPLRDIAGSRRDSIFIVTAQPDKIIVTNSHLGNVKTMDLIIKAPRNLTGNFTTTLFNDKLYILGYNVPCVVEYDLKTSGEVIYPVNRAFSRGIILSPSSVMIRGFDAQFKDEQLRKLNLLSGTDLYEKGITDKTEGGGFVTDGLLQYDELTHIVVFNHFYCNRILYLDTNLHLIRTGSSIDTFKNYTAQARAIPSAKGTYFTFSKPPKLLSENSCVNDGRLFIQSRLKADNETPNQFDNNIILDMYDIKSGTYASSFYLPALPGKHLLNFKVFDNKLYALYDDRIIEYLIR